MDKLKVKLTIQSSPNWESMVEKILDFSEISLEDLKWWWNESKTPWENLKYAKRIMEILIEEKALLKVVGKTNFYEKSSTFVELLKELLEENNF